MKMAKETIEASKSKNLAAVRIRGVTGVKRDIEHTLQMIRLHKKNYCCVLLNTTINAGILRKAKDYITWGEIDDETYNLLAEKRGEEYNGRETDAKKIINYDDFVVVNNKKIKKYFRLNAPRKGFGRKGIKHPFQSGGALGYRGEKINDLIKRMV